jgi:hypothetical protein
MSLMAAPKSLVVVAVISAECLKGRVNLLAFRYCLAEGNNAVAVRLGDSHSCISPCL